MSRPSALRRLVQAAAFVAAGCSMSAWAQVPASALQLTFVTPSATVSATDVIPIVLRLTNLDANNSFLVDNSLPNLGLDPSLLPATGNGNDPVTGDPVSDVPFASYSSAQLIQAFGCSGSFTNGCDPGAYSFAFGDAPFSNPYSLAPGASFDFLLGNFSPVGGAAPAGSYEFYRGVLGLYVFGADSGGNALSNLQFIRQTCNFDSAAACADVGFFTRNVIAVPEPASTVLMALGLCAVGWQMRRRLATPLQG